MAVLDEAAFGATSETPPKYVSPVDPAARWTAAASGPAVYAMASPGGQDHDQAPRRPSRSSTGGLAADTGYGSAENLAWLVDEQRIEPHIPVFDKSTRREGTFSRADFAYDADADRYTCSAGKVHQRYSLRFKNPRGGGPKAIR